MKRLTWTIRGVLGLWGLLGWLAIGSGAAQAAVIFPVGTGTTPDTSSLVTISIFQNVGGVLTDVTTTWLPEPGETVQIVVNGLSSPTIGLAFDALTAGNPIANSALTTSAYPGTCTNFGSDTGADFTLVGSELRSNDCGGMAVIVVNPGTSGELKFVLPQDTDFDGIPDIFEAKFCAAATPDCLVRDADIDTGPLASSPCCDGISNFDEYRGFIVSGKHVRGDPKQKDLFLHLVNPADTVTVDVGGVPTSQFVTSASCGASCLGGGTTTYPTPTTPNASLTPSAASGTGVAFTASVAVFSTAHVRGEIIATASPGRARITAVNSATSAVADITEAFPDAAPLSAGSWKLSESLFAALYSLVAPDRIHLLQYAPGATNFKALDEWVESFGSLVPPQTLTVNVTDPPDRTVNRNRRYGLVQRGVRVMEGLNTASASTLGWAYGVGSPNEVGNIDVFTQRIINHFNGLFDDGAGALVRYSTFVNGDWTTPTLVGDGVPGVAGSDVRNFIISKAIQFYLGMEVGHTLELTPTVMGTQKTSYGYHYAPFTGDCLDQAIETKVKSGFNTFWIPSLCGSTDQSEFLINP